MMPDPDRNHPVYPVEDTTESRPIGWAVFGLAVVLLVVVLV